MSVPSSASTLMGATRSIVGTFSGFCLLMERAVYEAVGGLDERFGLGFFDDDDDLAERAGHAVYASRP